MRICLLGFCIMAAAFGWAGCASAPRAATAPAAPIIPAPVPPAPPEAVQGDGAIYRNPRIGKIYLRAHEDANGRLLGPQVIYQIVEPGGWNVAALDHGEPGTADPRLRAGAPRVLDPAAGWMLVPAQPANSDQIQGEGGDAPSSHPTEPK
jgi:hypothetical protein